jgi:predicted ATPase
MADALRFTRLKLTNWRNFRSVDVALDMRAFFIGPNASGKSNLLDSIRFLSELARPGTGGLRAAVEGRGGFSSLRCLQARTIPYVEIEATMGFAGEDDRWRYRLTKLTSGLLKGRTRQGAMVHGNTTPLPLPSPPEACTRSSPKGSAHDRRRCLVRAS